MTTGKKKPALLGGRWLAGVVLVIRGVPRDYL